MGVEVDIRLHISSTHMRMVCTTYANLYFDSTPNQSFINCMTYIRTYTYTYKHTYFPHILGECLGECLQPLPATPAYVHFSPAQICVSNIGYTTLHRHTLFSVTIFSFLFSLLGSMGYGCLDQGHHAVEPDLNSPIYLHNP